MAVSRGFPTLFLTTAPLRPHIVCLNIFISGGSDEHRNTLVLGYGENENQWNSTEFPGLSVPRTKHACAVHFGQIYIMGGRNTENEEGMKSVEILDFESKIMSDGPELPFNVFDAIGLEHEDELYLGMLSE